MLRLILFLILLIASVWLGLAVVHHQGYLLVYYQPWMVQMPIWFALAAFIIFFAIFYFIIDSIDRLEFLWFRFKNWLRIRGEHKSYSKTQHGLTMLIEGRWKKAEHLLLSGMKQSFEPLMNYLGAAKAAHEQGAFERRDEYIQKAHTIAPDADLAIGLTQAEFDLSQDHVERAAAILNHLRETAPYHPRILQSLEKIYVRLGDWKNLEALLPSMRKAKIINQEQMALFEKNIFCEMLNAAKFQNQEVLQNIWDNTPRATRKNPEVILAYVKQLLRVRDTKQAGELIRKTLKNSYQPELVQLYGTLPFENINRQLVIVGAWLKMYGQKPETLLTLGRLCMRAQLWGKAKGYFEQCLAEGPNSQASLEYGKLLEKLGDSDQALQKYREGLAQAN